MRRTGSPVARQRYQKYISVIIRKGRPSWHQSEKDLQYLIVKKTNFPDERNAVVSIKNYNIQNPDAFLYSLKQQIARSMQQHVISPLLQRIILDARGQRATGNQLLNLVQRIAGEVGLPRQNVQVVTW